MLVVDGDMHEGTWGCHKQILCYDSLSNRCAARIRPFIVFQLQHSNQQALKIELQIMGSDRRKRRLEVSTSRRRLQLTPNPPRAVLPLPGVRFFFISCCIVCCEQHSLLAG